MSKNKVQNLKAEKPKKLQDEPMSKKEILVFRIIGLVAILIIAIIILTNIPWQGEKERIARKFETLSIDNVFTYIKYDEIQEKIINGENFEVLLIDIDQENCDYFIYCVDYIVKEYKKQEISCPEEIYLFNLYNLKDEEKPFFKEIDRKYLNNPTLINFRKGETKDTSVDFDCSNRYNLKDFNNNYYNLLLHYFDVNYNL